jgi:hypothetical protein
MADTRVSRNDPCPCGSGKKFKKCCMLRGIGISGASNAGLPSRAMRGSPLGDTPPLTPPRSSPRQGQCSGAFDDGILGESDDYPEPPRFDTVPLLPVEIGLHYTYPEPFGEAEVTYILPAGQPYILASGEEILNDHLKPGMRIRLKDGAVATISHVELYYEPPDPPQRGEDDRVLSRVVGTIKHKGFSTVDVSWPGYKATSSPDHPYYSVSRGGYVGAQELKVGEFLRTDDNLLTPVLAVSKPKFEMVDLYNVEIEHYHNYYVGQPGGSAVLVHNSATPGNYINTPAKGTGRGSKGQRLPATEGSWVEGTPGNGVWRSTRLDVRKAAAAPGGPIPDHVDVPFKNNYPVFNKYIKDVHGIRGETKITSPWTLTPLLLSGPGPIATSLRRTVGWLNSSTTRRSRHQAAASGPSGRSGTTSNPRAGSGTITKT